MFTRLPIPTPFQVGPVNCYLAGHTLIDPGPGTEESWAALLNALESNDLTETDIERVLITHPHPDHFGLAARLQDAGATVYASERASDILADFPGRLSDEQAYFKSFFEANGMSESTAELVTDLPESFLAVAPSVTPDVELQHGDTVSVDGVDVTARGVVGHAIGETIYEYETDESAAVVGDHVLADITPNPLLQPPETDDSDRPPVLPAYNRSLEALRDTGYDRFLPGHREIIDDPAGRIDEMLAEHETRTETVYDLVDGPTTALEVMTELFPDLPVTEYFSGMSEAVGHLDVLELRGRVTCVERGGVSVYERT